MTGYAPRPVLIVVGYSPVFSAFFLHAKQFAHLPQTHFTVSPTHPVVLISISGNSPVCDEIAGSGECRNSSSSSASGSAGSDVAGGSDEGMEKISEK